MSLLMTCSKSIALSNDGGFHLLPPTYWFHPSMDEELTTSSHMTSKGEAACSFGGSIKVTNNEVLLNQ